MYNNAKELIELAKAKNLRISEIVLENECKITEKTSAEVLNRLLKILRVMQDSVKAALREDTGSISGFSGGDAKRVELYRENGTTLCGDVVNRAMVRALSCSEINACMGKIVAAPTAGSCGIVPAAIITAVERMATDNLTKENLLLHALLTASGVGQIIAKNATLSGAEGGCQAECGAASAMAAAALTELGGGAPEMAFQAAAIALINVMGLVCDPVAGLVEIPCVYRNAMGVVNAMSCADLALAGVKSRIPFDEVVIAMYKVGKQMPSCLKETAMGGLAETPTGLKLAARLTAAGYGRHCV